MPESLNCPNCGGPSVVDATRCEYCGSRLAAVACPVCFGSMFVGSQFCSHCGAKVVDAEGTAGATLACPGCAGTMPRVKVGSASMNACDNCGSVWLIPDEFARLCSDRDATGALVTIVGGSADPVRSPLRDKVRYVRCCVCNNTMNRVNFGHTSGVIVDVCKGHGVWFERDELRQVLGFIQSGGLQKRSARVAGLGPMFDGSTSVQRSVRSVSLHFDGSTGAPPSASRILESFLNALFS